MRALLVLLALLACACPPPADHPSQPPEPTVTTTSDPIGPKPELGPPRAFAAPEPTVYTHASGITVWLVERPAIPVVSLVLSVPRGAAEDPPGKAGLAHITAAMLDEGAGDRDALAISTEINDLGAQLDTSTSLDGSRVSLSVLKKHVGKAFPIFADVIARPRFDPQEWKRVHDLWLNQLRRRADDPQAVARLVRSAVMYGPDTPYGHAVSGGVDTAKAIGLDDARRFHQRMWRRDEALLVVAGAINRSEVDALIGAHLAGWAQPEQPAPPRLAPQKPLDSRPRLVLVDRPEAPQAMITVATAGVAAGDPAAALLELVNTALGGSFTSRLNQNLREDHSWTYGAGSAFVETRGQGVFLAQASVFKNVTAPALREMLNEMDKLASQGLSEEELAKVRARDITELIEKSETVDDIAGRLTTLSQLGLPHDHDARASAARQQATLAALNELAKAHIRTKDASVIVVGPRDELLPQLRTLDLGEPELWSAEGLPLGKPGK